MNPKVVTLASQRKAPRECSEILLEMATEAEAGDIVSVAVIFERADGSTGNWQSGTTGQCKMAGMLLDAAVRRLNYAEND